MVWTAGAHYTAPSLTLSSKQSTARSAGSNDASLQSGFVLSRSILRLLQSQWPGSQKEVLPYASVARGLTKARRFGSAASPLLSVCLSIFIVSGRNTHFQCRPHPSTQLLTEGHPPALPVGPRRQVRQSTRMAHTRGRHVLARGYREDGGRTASWRISCSRWHGGGWLPARESTIRKWQGQGTSGGYVDD